MPGDFQSSQFRLRREALRLRYAMQRPAQAAFVAGLALLTYLSLMPQEKLPGLPLSDKLEHASAYALLTLAGAVAFRGGTYTRRVGLGLVGLGLVFEVLQTLVPGRAGEFGDALANIIGVGFAIALVAALRHWFADTRFAADREAAEVPAATGTVVAAGSVSPPRSSSGR